MSWRRNWRWLGWDGDDDLTKLFLNHLTNGRALETYRSFLRSTMNLHVAHGQLHRLEDSLLLKFYQEDRLLTPKYLDVRKSADLAKLERVLQLRIIIIRPFGGNESNCDKISDTRIFDVLAGEVKPSHFFALDRRDSNWHLYTAESFNLNPYSPFSSEEKFAATSVKATGCFHADLSALLKTEPPSHECGLNCSDLLRFCSTDENRRMWATQTLFVSHVRSTLSARRTSAHAHQTYARLGVLRCKGEQVSRSPDVKVVCLTNNGMLYLPVAVLSERLRDPGKESKTRLPQVESYPDMEYKKEPKRQQRTVGQGCASCKEAPLYNTNMNAAGPQLLYKAPLSTFDLLKMTNLSTPENVEAVLRACRLSSAYFDLESCTSKPKSAAGDEDAEMPFSAVSDLFAPRKFLHTQRAIRVGYTDGLDLERGVEPVILRAERGGASTEDIIVTFADDLLRKRDEAVCVKYEILSHLFTTLEKVRVRYMDFFRAEGLLPRDLSVDDLYQDFGPDLVELDSDEEEDEADWSLFEDEELPAKKAKRGFVTPTELLEKRRKRQALEVVNSWKFSLLGRLESNLDRLCQKQVVWSFSGARYDHPLIAGTILTRFKQLGLSKLGMSRDGGSVNSIRGDGIIFADVKKLLPAGASLAKFREMADLEPDKYIFPFHLLDEDLDFLDRQELPADASDWTSDLSGEAPSQERVDEVRKMCADKGWSVSAFFDFYLSEDVKMLALGTQKLTHVFYELFSLDLVDSGKLTISSLSAYAAQVYLFWNKSPGMFSCNGTKAFAMLSRGCRGGINFVGRTWAGKDCPADEYVKLFKDQRAAGLGDALPNLETDEAIEEYLRRINGHLKLSDPFPANFVKYGDVSALYSKSSECQFMEKRTGGGLERRGARVRAWGAWSETTPPTASSARGGRREGSRASPTLPFAFPFLPSLPCFPPCLTSCSLSRRTLAAVWDGSHVFGRRFRVPGGSGRRRGRRLPLLSRRGRQVRNDQLRFSGRGTSRRVYLRRLLPRD